MRALPLLAPLLAAAPAAQLVTGTQIADVNQDPTVVGSYNGGFTTSAGLVYFGAVDAASNESYRVWATDGTAGGTVQLSDVALNPQHAVALPGGGIVFSVDELGVGVGLWRSDGTAAGTSEVFAPIDWIAPPEDLVVFQGAAWFLASVEGSGKELWRSDLTTGVTALHTELVPGPASGASHLFTGAGRLFVAGQGQETLHAYDGTTATQVASFAQATPSSFDHAAEVGGAVVFDVGGFGAQAGWWRSDGTAAGTFQLRATSNDQWAVQGATRVWFTAGGVASTPLLWQTDGTLAGTVPVDLPSTTGGQTVTFAKGVAIGDELFYGGVVPGAGTELCRTAGAAAGAQLAADIHPGGSSAPDDLVLFGGEVYARAEDGSTGREIWRYDPVAGAASLTADLSPGPFSFIVGASPTILPAAHGVVFGQSFPGVGVEPGVVNATSAGLLLNIASDGASGGSDPREFLRLGPVAVFQATDEATGAELWVTDGTAPGTQLLADIDPTPAGLVAPSGSFPRLFARLGDKAVFFARHPASGSEPWVTDGTTAGTRLLADLVPGPTGSEPLFSARPVELGGLLFFIAREPSGAFGLYQTDGTPGGTAHVVTTDVTGILAEFVRLERIGEHLVFPGEGPIGLELWTSDGTAVGTQNLIDLTPGEGGTFVTSIVPGDTIGYVQASAQGSTLILRTDGTPAGTQVIFSEPFTLLGGVGQLFAVGDDLLFTRTLPATGRELWFSDGTPGGTQLLLDIVPGPESSDPLAFTRSGDHVYFAVESPPGSNHYQQIWRTDLTTAGTQLVAELPSPVAGAGVGDLWAPGADGGLVFSNVDANGEEWWATDGTAAGTFAVADVAPGPQFAEPEVGVLVGGNLVFAASNGVDGEEVHAMSLAVTGGFAATSLGNGCSGANGAPRLSLSGGAIALGQAFDLRVEDALPSSLALWVWDTTYTGLPALGTCQLQLAVPNFLASTATDAAGVGILPASVPNQPALVGAVLDLQALSVELGGPFLGLGALSDVLEIVVGP